MSVHTDLKEASDELNSLIDKNHGYLEEYRALDYDIVKNEPDPKIMEARRYELYRQYNDGRNNILERIHKLKEKVGKLSGDYNRMFAKNPMLTDDQETPDWLRMIDDKTYDLSNKFTIKEKDEARRLRDEFDARMKREGK